jgi:Protein of unknown function (DUF2889)
VDFTPPLDTAADVYRRRITVETISTHETRCELQDDFHHFIVTMTHAAGAVETISAESRRFPWATCPHAESALEALIGIPLSERFTAAARYADASKNCTHQFDAAAHAITHTAAIAVGHRTAARQYDCEIGATLATSAAGPGRNRVWVDGVLTLEWMIRAGRGPDAIAAPFDAAPWRGGFMRWADATLEPNDAEVAIVLRRACDIGMGRGMDLDAVPEAGQLLQVMSGVCYTMQPETAIGSLRNVGTIEDFAASPERLQHNVGEAL